MRSDRLGETLLPKRIALPVFASDALSSVAYAPDEIFLTLSLAGGAFATTHSWQIGLAVVAVMLVVVASYRQNVHAYPSGGGDYEVATVNLGARAGLTVASALLVDYVLTVAVSISSGVQNAAAALPGLRGHETAVAISLVVLLTAVNLRGVRESGAAFAIPTYAFIVGILAMALFGFYRYANGSLPLAESGNFTLVPERGYTGIAGLAMVFLLLRAFSSGSAALTGVEAISNGVPAFKKPKSKNAATTLLLMGILSVTMLMSIITLVRLTGAKFVDLPQTQLLQPNGKPVPSSYTQETIIGQLSKTVFSNFHPGVVFISIVTGIILILAANTAFNGFPVLASILAKDNFLPHQLHTRGDRLAYSNGILILAGAAAFLIFIYHAQVTKLIQLYIVGVFVSFTLSQTGMIRHWNRHLRTERDPKSRGRMRRSRAINTVGAFMSGTVLLVVLATKFIHGAGYAIAAMVVLFIIMNGIQRHYARVRNELAVEESTDEQMLPSRVHAIVLVSRIHKPTLRALAYARATRPSLLEAITVNVDPEETTALQDDWDRRGIPVALKVLDSPYREITSSVVDYVKTARRGSPRDVVMVYVPEYVVGRWYEHLLHNQTALRLKSRLYFTPGVMVTSVPWQLRSSEGAEERLDGSTAGSVRRGQ
jgi:amino acid transporter